MKITFGCIIIYKKKILLVREKSEKSKQLEKWNFLSSTTKLEEAVFKEAVKRAIKEESGVKVVIKGIIGVYESVTPKDTSLYFVVGCKASSDKITTTDPEVIEIKWFDLDEFFKLKEKEIVHKDMWLCARNFLKGKYINLIKTVKYK